MRTLFLLPLAAALSLVACNGSTSPEPVETETPAPDLTPLAEPALPAGFTSPDCATMLAAYGATLGTKDFDIAARAWADPVIDSERLAARYRSYGKPELVVGETKAGEGAAGVTYCDATVTLRDADDKQRPLKQGTLRLRRMGSGPGVETTPETTGTPAAADSPNPATDQMRWRIESSTLAEDLERAGDGAPA